MKRTSKLAVLLSLGALLASAAPAKTLEQAYLDSCRKDPNVPVPTEVTMPQVGAEYVGQTVTVGFVVDTAGRPVDVSAVSAADPKLAEAVVEAVKQWRFRPARRNGVPAATKVVLPVNVVAGPESRAGYAYNR